MRVPNLPNLQSLIRIGKIDTEAKKFERLLKQMAGLGKVKKPR